MTAVLEQRLQGFFSIPRHEARRIFHGRGQCYPGLEHLCIDWFGPVVLVSAWAPVDSPQTLKAQLLDADIHGQIESILLQRRFEDQAPAEVLHGPEPDRVIVKAQGLLFEVRPGRRQNAGLFLDMDPLRKWLLENSDGKNVLNLFSYTCALSVTALDGGASSVTNVDMSKPSIAWGVRNHQLNGQDMACIHNVPHNLFKSWGRIQQFGRYDLVIIDPPSRQKGSFDAERDYKTVVKRLTKLCNPGAMIIAALNSPFLGRDFLTDCFSRHLPACELLEIIPPSAEFVETDPDKGLKIACYRYRPQS